MAIPSSFQLLGHTIKVVYDPTLEDRGRVGEASYQKMQILISPKATASMAAHTFWHEVVHHILQMMSYDKLCDDEEFVDRMGAALHQVTSTMEYKGKRK